MNETVYKALAERNGWYYFLEGERPYFYKNDVYAVPDETTSEEDKELLAEIISEGSVELKKLLIDCWNNKIKIGGPCSGIKEFHDPIEDHHLQFRFIGSEEFLIPLYTRIKEALPNLIHHIRINSDEKDNYYSIHTDNSLTIEESNAIYAIIREQLQICLNHREEVKETSKDYKEVMEIEKLADRNGWTYCWDPGSITSFSNNSNDWIAIPNETTTEEDKELLLNIQSAGSPEMKQLILACWEIGIGINNATSKSKNNKYRFKISFYGSEEDMKVLESEFTEEFPDFYHNRCLCGIQEVPTYSIDGDELTKEQCEEVIAIIRKRFQNLVRLSKSL